MEENLDPNITDITDQIEKLSLKNNSPSQEEIRNIVTILSLREKVVHSMIERCEIETSTCNVTASSFQKLKDSKEALLELYNQAEIRYSESSKTTQNTIDHIERKDRFEPYSFLSYNFIKSIIDNIILLNENQKLQLNLAKRNIIFEKKTCFLAARNTIASIQYKIHLAKAYQKYYSQLTVKTGFSKNIFEVEHYLCKLSQKNHNALFNIFFNIHILHLRNFIESEVKLKTKAIVNLNESRLKKRYLQKKYVAINAVLRKNITTNITLETAKIEALPLPPEIVVFFTRLLSIKESISHSPSYLVYLKFLYNKSAKLVPQNLLKQHTTNIVSLIIKHASLLELLLDAIPNSHATIKNIFSPEQQKPHPPQIQKKKRNRKRTKKTSQPSTINKKGTTETGPKITAAKKSHIETTVKKNNRKRTRKRNKKKNRETTQPATDNQQTNLTVEQEKKETFLELVVTPTSNSIPLINDNLTYLEQHYINPASDIIHKETTVYVCILDLIRALFGGFQNKIFIPKNPHPLPFNPLKNITYSKYVLDQKMSREHDNNHAFSPLVREYGQHGYIKDQDLSDIQKKSLGTKHKIKNSTQYKLLHTVYLPARIASLGYPVERFEQNGCTANGEFEFTFVRKDHNDPGICIHRFFRPYN